MAELIPIREAARRLGVSDTAVRKAIAAGRVKVAAEHPKNGRPLLSWPEAGDAWQANSNAAKRTHVGGTGKSVERAKYAKKSAEIRLPLAGMDDGEPPSGHVDPEEGDQAIGFDADGDPVITNSMTLADATRAKTIIDARQRLLALKTTRGELVDRAKMQAKVFKAARVARDSLQTMEDRLAPILASCTDIQEVRQVLRDDIRRVCERIAASAQSL